MSVSCRVATVGVGLCTAALLCSVWCVAPVTLCGCLHQRMVATRQLPETFHFPPFLRCCCCYHTGSTLLRSRMETKPVITCLKTLLIVYSFVFWVGTAFRYLINPAENDRNPSTKSTTACRFLCVCVVVVHDEGVDRASIIDGIIIMSEYTLKDRPLASHSV